MPKKVKTPMQVAIAALEERRKQAFQSALRLYEDQRFVSAEDRVQAKSERQMLNGLTEAIKILQGLDTAE